MQDHKYVRSNKNPGAVINTDEDALRLYKARKIKEKNQREEIKSLREDVNEIKSLLLQLLDKK